MNLPEIDFYPVPNTKLVVITLTTAYGKVKILNLGATILSIEVPDKDGIFENVVLSYRDPLAYYDDSYYVGATVGRVAGRISRSSFKIGEKLHAVSANVPDTGNHLHGGHEGFNKKLFSVSDSHTENGKASVTFYYRSEDMEEGYPGNLDLYVTYAFCENELTISYSGKTDILTPVNITNHSYFNLGGPNSDALNQMLEVASDHILTTDENYIPTGEMLSVAGTSFDFRKAVAIGEAITGLTMPGFNEFYVLDKSKPIAARLYHPQSRRALTVRTSYPGILFYSGDYLSGGFRPNLGVCLEAQYHPDAVNNSSFPNIFVSPDLPFQQNIYFSFSVS